MSEILAWLTFLEMLGGAAKSGPPGPPGPPGPMTPGPYDQGGGGSTFPAAPAPTAAPPLKMPPPGDIGPPPAAAPVPAVVPAPTAPPVSPGALPPMPPWPSPPTPGTLPPFPGSGWCPDTPVTSAVATRAAYWNPQLWDYTSKTIRKAFVQEQFGGSWVTFSAAWHPGSAGPKTYMATEAWRLCTAPPIAPPTPGPVAPAPSVVPMGKPGPVGPEPAPGAWQSNAGYIGRYQAALTWLSQQGAGPFDPGGIDGKYGPHTATAVKAFQTAHALAADGQCGNATAAMLDAAMGYTSAAPAMPVAPAAAAAAPAAVPFTGPPPQVMPYPGPGAWQSNAAYIARYQAALSYLGGPFDTGGVDGKYGPHTAAAVKAFQSAHGLAADGQCGASTAAAIDAVVASGGAG